MGSQDVAILRWDHIEGLAFGYLLHDPVLHKHLSRGRPAACSPICARPLVGVQLDAVHHGVHLSGVTGIKVIIQSADRIRFSIWTGHRALEGEQINHRLVGLRYGEAVQALH
ncbi:hypothetical protein D3C73_1312970 [compost metagenome]